MPHECATEEDSPFSSSSDDWGGDGDDDWDFKRRKRSVGEEKSAWDKMAKPKAEFINCTCEWGLFRDRNITMRKPIEFLSGVGDLTRKGRVLAYDGKDTLGFWKKNSVCDKVRGQDASTIPPGITPDMNIEMFIALMCRPITMKYELTNQHANIRTHRYIPPPNALGAHDDPDPKKRNPDNECYCLKDEKFECFKTGVYNMQPCKRETNAPLALSYPHFYEADPSYLEAVDGLKPEKEKHQFFIDIVPEFGFPLAIRPRFQLNIVIGDFPEWDVVSQMKKKIVLPFLWAQDGFDEPSEKMAEAIAFGLAAPKKISLLGAVVFFVLGGALILASMIFFFLARRSQSNDLVAPK